MQGDEGAGQASSRTAAKTAKASSAEGECFPKASRIRARSDYLRIQSEGLRITTPHLVLIVLPRETEDLPTRLGVVASRKVGGSVVRSRAKRLIREVFRRSRALFPKAADVVVIARPGLDALGFEAVRREVASASHRLSARLRRRVGEHNGKQGGKQARERGR